MKWYLFCISLIVAFYSCKTVEEYKIGVTKELIFVKENVLVDENLFASSISDMKTKLKSQILLEREEESVVTDTNLLNILLENMTPLLYDLADDTKVYNYFKLQDSLIISFQKINNEIKGDYTVINRNSGSSYKLAKKDSTFRYSYISNLYNEKDISVVEDRDDIKIINGHKCFKVTFSDTEDMDDYFPTLIETQYELYVTDEIRLKFHPFFRYKQILSKYFPIQIKESNSFVKGKYTNYKMQF